MALKQRAPETFAGTTEEHLRRVARVVNSLQDGFGNHAFRVTLDEDPATSTEILRPLVRSEQVANLTPESASAAADMAAGTTWAETETGKVTIHHAAGGADRQYGVVLGG